MSSPLLDLEPKLLWEHFDGIRQIPRPSKHEEKITEHVENWASDHGYEVQKDEAGTMEGAVARTPDMGRHTPVVAPMQATAPGAQQSPGA